MADALGVTTAGVLRLAIPDDDLLGSAAGALHRLGFSFVVEKGPDGPGAGRAAGGWSRRPPAVRHLRLEGGVEIPIGDSNWHAVPGIEIERLEADPRVNVDTNRFFVNFVYSFAK